MITDYIATMNIIANTGSRLAPIMLLKLSIMLGAMLQYSSYYVQIMLHEQRWLWQLGTGQAN